MQTHKLLLLATMFTLTAPAALAQEVVVAVGDESLASEEFVAQCPAHSGSDRKCEPVQFSDDQLERLHAARTQYKATVGAKKAELGTLHRQLLDALSAASFDKKNVLAIQTKINAVMADIGTARATMLADVSSVYTNEQREKVRKGWLKMEAGPLGVGPFPMGGPGGMHHHQWRHHGHQDHESFSAPLPPPGGPGGPGAPGA